MTQSQISTVVGILLPFVGTTAGSAFVFFLKKNVSSRTTRLFSGFASGIMTAAAVWSLLLPACELAENQNVPEFIPCIIGFVLGAFFMIFANRVAELKIKNENHNIFMLVFAVTLHNIPEGMAVGAAIAGCCASDNVGTAAAASLCIGIAIQNIPEGAVISMPSYANGKSKTKSFFGGTLSGAVEPVGAVFTLLLTSIIVPALPYLLSFAAGAMIYTVFGEMVVAPTNNENESTANLQNAIGACIGFAIMMLLDISLG